MFLTFSHHVGLPTICICRFIRKARLDNVMGTASQENYQHFAKKLC